MSNTNTNANEATATRRWYCWVQGRELGPLTDGQLRELGHDGQLARSDKVWNGTEGEWVLAEQVRGLFSEQGPQSAPALKEWRQEPSTATPSVPTATPSRRRRWSANKTAKRKRSTDTNWFLVGGGATLAILTLGFIVWWFDYAGESNTVAVAEPTAPPAAPSPSASKAHEAGATAANENDSASTVTAVAGATKEPQSPAGETTDLLETDPPVVESETNNSRVEADSTARGPEPPPGSASTASAEPTEFGEAADTDSEDGVVESAVDVASDDARAPSPREVRIKREREWIARQLETLDAILRRHQEGSAAFNEFTRQVSEKQAEQKRHVTLVALANEQLPKLEREYFSNKDWLFDVKTNRKRALLPQEIQQTEGRQRAIETEVTQHNKNLRAAKVAEPNLKAEFARLNVEEKAIINEARQLHLEAMDHLDPYGIYPEAYRIELLRHSASWPPDFVYGKTIRAFAQIQVGKFHECKETLSQVITGLDHLVNQKRAMNRPRSPDRDQKAKQISPDVDLLQAAYAGRGLAEHHLGDERESLRDLGKAIALNTHSPLPHVLRGIVRSSGKAAGAGLDDLDNAKQRDKEYAAGFREAARLRLTSTTAGNLKRALEDAETAQALTADEDWSSLEVYAMALAAVGQMDEARASYAKAIELAPVDRLDELEAALAKLSAGKL